MRKTPDKTSAAQLNSIPRDIYRDQPLSKSNAVLYTTDRHGYRFDLLWQPKPRAKRLFVLFSGDALRDKKSNEPPVFQRWSWASRLPGHCLYVSDPGLYIDKTLSLTWYAGTDRFDVTHEVATIIKEVCSQLSLPTSHVVAYGSSGGGFAALRLATFLPDIMVVAINPQTDITKFKYKSVEKYLDICFGGLDRENAMQVWPERFSLLNNAERLKNTKIILAQNTLDIHHYRDHYKPFCRAMGRGMGPQDVGRFRRILFQHEDGHKAAETMDVFDKIMSHLENWNPRTGQSA